MATFVLVPGAGSDPWYWHLVVPLIEAAGHETVAVDLPVDDDRCGLSEYAACAVEAIADRTAVTIVAQSMGAFTAPLVAAQRPVDLIVLVAPMVPSPGESPGAWWENTGQPQAARDQAIREGRDPDAEFDPVEMFLHDVPSSVAAESAAHVRRQSQTPFDQPWPLEAWPSVPTRALIGRRDRLFPAEFQRRILSQRLGVIPDEIDSGHLPALSRFRELSERLLDYQQLT